MEREIVCLEDMKATGSPLSPAVKANGLVFCSGQLPMDPQTGMVVSVDIKLQTRQVLENLARVLEAAGTTLSKTLKVTVYLTDLSGFAAMNEVYKQFFPIDPPARTMVAIIGLARPGCLLEVDLVALS